jgi:nicotinate-nucleotide adenylyltransferase
MTRGKRLGVLGGTFNPIHLGHLRVAEEVREQLGLAQMILVPSATPPHKDASARDPIAPAELRLAWVRAAVAGNPGLAVDAMELERGGRSYTIETVRAIAARAAPEPPVFTIGHDAFAELDTWRDPDALLREAHLAVMTRPPNEGSLADWMPRCAREAFELASDGWSARHRSGSTWIRRVDVTALDISSTDIRERLRSGRSVRYLVPEAIREDVERSGVYALRTPDKLEHSG